MGVGLNIRGGCASIGGAGLLWWDMGMTIPCGRGAGRLRRVWARVRVVGAGTSVGRHATRTAGFCFFIEGKVCLLEHVLQKHGRSLGQESYH